MLASEAKGRGFDPRSAYHLLFCSLLIFFAPSRSDGADLYVKSAAEVSAAFDLVSYHPDDPSVPPLFCAYMPEDMAELSDRERVSLFLRTLLPLILRENERIEQEARRLDEAATRSFAVAGDAALVYDLALKYRLMEEGSGPLNGKEIVTVADALRTRIRPVAPSIVLTIAALESGWGTSRFTREANNLFGHTALLAWRGIQPAKWRGTSRNIKRFETIADALRRFMLNLNSNRAYARYRKYRDLAPTDTFQQAKGFTAYASIGKEYVVRMQQIMKRFGFARYDGHRLADETRLWGLDRLRTPYLY